MTGRKRALSKADYIFLTLFKQKYRFSTTRNVYEFVQPYIQKRFSTFAEFQKNMYHKLKHLPAGLIKSVTCDNGINYLDCLRYLSIEVIVLSYQCNDS